MASKCGLARLCSEEEFSSLSRLTLMLQLMRWPDGLLAVVQVLARSLQSHAQCPYFLQSCPQYPFFVVEIEFLPVVFL